MNPYFKLASELARLIGEAKTFPLGGLPPCPRPAVAEDAPKVLFFAPHPDDETIQGGLALRLLREAKWNVINVAVTLGSKKGRQQERLAELKNASEFIGFGLLEAGTNGLEHVTPKTRVNDKPLWAEMVKTIAAILTRHQPKVIFFPHDEDWNDTHIGLHHLLLDALRSLPPGFRCFCVETEFWGQNDSPNLLVEYNTQEVADLMAA
ncbi:MAG: PIG-L family deacetylase, partial [Verrucomicrobiota bacterium]